MLFKKLRKTASGLLTLVLISCCLLGATLAKYTTTVEASDSARAAIFDVSPGTNEEFEFKPFDTIYDTIPNKLFPNTVWDKEYDIWSHKKDQVIAPGTRGKYKITLQSRSEVAVRYDLTFQVDNQGAIPLEYSLDGKTWTSDISELHGTGTFTHHVDNSSRSETFYWRWPYESGDDAHDTSIGKNGNVTLDVTGNITFTQID